MFEEEKQNVIDACKQLQREGSVIGTWGNVSVRCDDKIVLTPSRVAYDDLTVEDMVVMSLEGEILESPRGRVPTSEREVHRQLYLARKDIKAVVHAHTLHAMAVSTLPIVEVPCLVEEMSQLLGGSIPLTKRYVPAEQHEKLGMAAAEVIGDRGAMLLRNHGPVSCAPTLEEALLSVKVVERACELYLSVMHSDYNKIPEQFVISERYRYTHTYGKEV